MLVEAFSTKIGYCNAEVGGRLGLPASTYGFREITRICLGLLTPYLLCLLVDVAKNRNSVFTQ